MYLADRVAAAAKEKGPALTQEQELAIWGLQSDVHKSASLGTVYFPYREPSGTITMVMTDGPECD